MSDKSELALDRFHNGYNCSQAILSVFCQEYGLSPQLAHKLTCGFGSGFKSGELCGSASGAVLVIGLKEGASSTEEKEKSAHCGQETAAFLKEFKKVGGSLVCKEILSMSFEEKSAMPAAEFQKNFRPRCNKQVSEAVLLLEKMGY